ncbi:class F sortase [Nocardioides piscis]|uniref:Class F sortase n=1 Tax=Nocardioides piscis TaxID=2714938 RepID=A0A6G7YGP8_9ACTN|nr:class F sortase [Nocardioides piscis]QIK75787.1 class F sortase [Nocardioides piscis]
MKRRAALLLAVVLCLEGAGVAGAAGAAGAVQAASREADAPEVRKAAVAPLRVPKLGIEGARVIPVGINERGQLAVGQSVSAVYTWNRGVRPGQPGSSVIAGHTWSRGEGVFDDLGNLRVGDRFFVGRASFVVNRVRRVRSLPP